MGLMKQYLMDKTRELADKLGIDEAKFYQDPIKDKECLYLYKMAINYAQYCLEHESNQP